MMAGLHKEFNYMFLAVVVGAHFDLLQDMKSAIHGLHQSLFIELEAWGPELMDCFCPCYGTRAGRMLRCHLIRKKFLKLSVITMG